MATTSAIQTLPGPSDAGLAFSYAAWTPNTTAQLANVPWGADYRDIVKFSSQAALDTYLASSGVAGPVFSNMTYAPVNRPVKVNLPFNSVYKYNYIRVYNPAMPVASGDAPRAFYYFITDVTYHAPNTTYITVMLDVWQTFGYNMVFGNSYIERGHIGIANTNHFDNYGRDYLTVPEGFDVGSEYNVVRRWSTELASARHLDGSGNPNFEVLITSTVSLKVDPGSVTAPVLQSALGSNMEFLPSGCEVYVLTLPNFINLMGALTTHPWVSQGIVSIQAIPAHTRYGASSAWQSTSLGPFGGTTIPAWSFNSYASQALGTRKNSVPSPTGYGWRVDVFNDRNVFPARYSYLSKFLTYPYCVAEVTSYTGTPVVLKPEFWSDDNATVVEVPHLTQPGAQIRFVPYRYNVNTAAVAEEDDAYGVMNDGGEWLDMATGIFNFPTFALVNNQYIEYMAANTHSIAFSFQNADWSQQKAMAGNANSFDIATRGLQTSQDVNAVGNTNALAQSQIANQAAIQGMGVDMARGAIGGAMAGSGAGGAGAVAGAGIGMAANAASTAIGVNARNASTSANISASQQANALQVTQGAYAAGANNRLANWAARGDYANEIAGINAKLQDAKLTQPSVSGQVGGDAFNLATGRMGYDVKVKMLNPAAMRVIGEYWLRYGYAVNQFAVMPSSLQCMTKFTYWKLKETYLTGGPCPETFKLAIRGIFEKGVTVWANPADIGTIDIGTNQPLTGVTL